MHIVVFLFKFELETGFFHLKKIKQIDQGSRMKKGVELLGMLFYIKEFYVFYNFY